MKNNVVYVISKDRKPLMPTRRFGKVRHLLETGKAVPINTNPFTIRLKYDTAHYVQDLYAGIDTGRENIGSAVSEESGRCSYLADTRTNNKSVKKNMANRAGFRSERRRHDRQNKQRKAKHDGTEMKNGRQDKVRTIHDCISKEVSYPGAEKPVTHKVIQGKEGKSNNRKRPDGWITPSARQLVQITMREIEQMCQIMPVTQLSIERVTFDFQKLANANIHGWQYTKGPLYGYKSYKDYIYDEQDGNCAICGAPIENYHHIHQKKGLGTDTVNNIIGLCNKCHEEIHHMPNAEEILEERKKYVNDNYSVSLLNSVMPVLIEEAADFCKEHGIRLVVTDGNTTSDARKKYGVLKDHCIDAYMISLAGREVKEIRYPDEIIQKRRFKKKSNNIISARNQREYQVDGKTVAWNRHQATDQKEPALDQYMEKYAEDHTPAECDRHFRSLVVKPARRTYTYHKTGYIASAHAGDVIRYEKHNKVKGNTKTRTFIAVSYSISGSQNEPQISYGNGNQNCKAKFCRPIESGCLHAVGQVKTDDYLKEAAKRDAEYKAKKAARHKQKAAKRKKNAV